MPSSDPERNAPRPGRASIVDVARVAGVSVATVSRALRGLENVSDSTRQRVIKAAEELEYAASPMASGLVTGRMRSVGVLTPFAGRWFFAEVLRGIEQGLRERGYDLVLHVLADPHRREEFFSDLPVRRRVDGLIIVGLPLEEHEQAVLGRLDIPLVCVGEAITGLAGESIDNQEAASLAVRHLIDLGHRSIAMIGGSSHGPEHFSVPGLRREGYVRTLEGSGLDVVPGFDVDGRYTAIGGEEAMAELLSRPTRPTAVFCQSDEMAFGALRALRQAGLRCPEDISVIGIDDHELSTTFDVTTVAQPVAAQGQAAAAWLITQIDQSSGPADPAMDSELDPLPPMVVAAADTAEHLTHFHPVNLIQRASTAGPARLR